MSVGKAAIYIRVSTDAQREEGYSIEAQTEKLQAYCVSKGISEYELFVDGGFTGSNIERPEMQRLIAQVKDKKISYVLVYKLDRLSRSQKDTLYLIEDVFLPNHVDFISLNENLDTSSPYGRAMIGILSAFAQLERENIRERTRMGMAKRIEAGYWMGGGRIPFGYDYDAARGILTPNKDAETVKKVYDLYLQGYSTKKVANMVGLKYERLAIQVLKRKSNAGYIVYNGQEFQGLHKPIVSLETYERAMDMMAARARNNLKSSANYLLSGLIYCGKCGAKMRYQKWGGEDKTKICCYSQYKQPAYLVKDPNCDCPKVWAEEIEDEVIKNLFQFSYDLSLADSETPIQYSVIDSLNTQYNACKNKIIRLYNLYGESGDELLLETIEATKRELDAVLKQKQVEEERNSVSDKVMKIKKEVSNIADVWDAMTKQERQNVARSLIDKITFDGDNVTIQFAF